MVIAVVVVALATLAVVAALFVRTDASDRSRHQFEDAANVAIDGIELSLQQSISQLNAIQGLFDSSEVVSRQEFSIFVERFLDEPGGISTLNWVTRVRASQKAQFIEAVRREGFAEFDIYPESESQDYFPVTYRVPFPSEPADIGFDLFSGETSAAALLTAWESGEIAATEAITLGEDQGNRLAVFVFAPVYSSKDIPATLQERQELLVGFATGVVSLGSFFQNLVPTIFDHGIDVTVAVPNDQSDGESILFTTVESGLPLVGDRGLHTRRVVDTVDRVLIFHFSAPGGYGLSWFDRTAWWFILCSGLLLSAGIAGFVYLLYRGRQTVLQWSSEILESEEETRVLLSAYPDIMMRMNRAGDYLSVKSSDSFQSFGGQVPDSVENFQNNSDLVGRNVTEILTEDLAQARLEAVALTLDSGRGQTVEYTVENAGKTLYREARITPIGGDEVLLIVRDVSERALAAEALRQSEVEFKRLALVNGALAEIGRIYSSSLEPADIWDRFTDEVREVLPFGRVVLIRADVEAGTVRQVHASGAFVADRDAVSDYPLAESLISSVIESRAPAMVRGEEFIELTEIYPLIPDLRRAGLHSYVLIPLISNDRVVGALIFFSEDPEGYSDLDLEVAASIGDHIVGAFVNDHLYAEIRELNSSLENRVIDRTRELQDALDDMEAFSYSVSHDLRGPLRSINGFGQAVAQKYGDRLDDEGRYYLESVRDATNQMGALIDDLLDLSRVGRAELIQEPLDLGKMVQDKEAELRSLDPERRVEFIIADDAPAFGDERLVGILIDNLVRNAWKFSSKHATALIELGKQQQNGETVFFIRDNGAGFDMEYADKLFSPFQRLHSSGEFEGTGIGLATVRRIVQRHGGRVWAEGEVERGATVFFTLEDGAKE